MKRLRTRAFANKDDKVLAAVTREIVAGWSFILSVSTAARREALLDAMAEEILAGTDGDAKTAECTAKGECGKDHLHLHMSARVNPTTRNSVPDDWENLGRALAALDVPDETIKSALSQITNDEHVATRAIHYRW